MQEDCQLRGEPGANDELLSGVALSKHLQQLQKVTGSRGSEKQPALMGLTLAPPPCACPCMYYMIWLNAICGDTMG